MGEDLTTWRRLVSDKFSVFGRGLHHLKEAKNPDISLLRKATSKLDRRHLLRHILSPSDGIMDGTPQTITNGMHTPKALLSFEQEAVAIVGVGSLGVGLVASLSALADQMQLVAIGASSSETVRASGVTYMDLGTRSANTDVHVAPPSALVYRHLPEIEQLLGGCGWVILVADLEQEAASGVANVIAQWAHQRDVQTIVLASIPDKTAPLGIIESAQTEWAQLQQRSNAVLISKPHLTALWVERLLSIIGSEAPELGSDAEDFLHFLQLSGPCTATSNTGRGVARAADAWSGAIASLPNATSEQVALQGLVCVISAKHPPSLSEIKYIMNQVSQTAGLLDAFRIFYVHQEDSMDEEDLSVSLLAKGLH